jgi:hypothetical protein
MKLHIFQSKARPILHGFTIDPSGQNLPAEFGHWENLGVSVPLAHLERAPIHYKEDVEARGYVLVEGADIRAALK